MTIATTNPIVENALKSCNIVEARRGNLVARNAPINQSAPVMVLEADYGNYGDGWKPGVKTTSYKMSLSNFGSNIYDSGVSYQGHKVYFEHGYGDACFYFINKKDEDEFLRNGGCKGNRTISNSVVENALKACNIQTRYEIEYGNGKKDYVEAYSEEDAKKKRKVMASVYGGFKSVKAENAEKTVAENDKNEVARSMNAFIQTVWKDCKEDHENRVSAFKSLEAACDKAIVQYWKSTGRY